MRTITKGLRFAFSSTIPIFLGFPFEYTLDSQSFALNDIRFTEVPFSRQLYKPQKEHIHVVLKNFEKIINGDLLRGSSDEFILKELRNRASQLVQIGRQTEFQLRFEVDLSSVNKSSGYYQIKPEGVSLLEKDIEDIHNYHFQRQKEVLRVSLKEKKGRTSPEEQLKKDIMEKMGNPGEDIREQIEKMTVSKEAVFYNRLVDGLLSIGKKKQNNTKFQSYYQVDQIKGLFGCEMRHGGEIYRDTQIQFDSKWLYQVNSLQSSDLKKYRRRILFDFQLWSRSSLFPIHNFAVDVASDE